MWLCAASRAGCACASSPRLGPTARVETRWWWAGLELRGQGTKMTMTNDVIVAYLKAAPWTKGLLGLVAVMARLA